MTLKPIMIVYAWTNFVWLHSAVNVISPLSGRARVSLLCALPTKVCTHGARTHLMTAIMLGCFQIDLHRREWLWL